MEDITKYEAQWIDEQNKLKELIITSDIIDKNKIKYVGGLDISFDKKDPSNVCAYLTIMDYNTLEIAYETYIKEKLTLPYVSGFLAFREMPSYLKLFNQLKKDKPNFVPDVLLLDGFGILHHRGCGIASHLGVVLNIPTIGVAKTILLFDGLDEKNIKNIMKEEIKKGNNEYKLIGTSGKSYGTAFAITGTTNPIYVTVGHGVSNDTALEIVKKVTKYRTPEPIRNSDIKSKLYF
jgi:endonuclease V